MKRFATVCALALSALPSLSQAQPPENPVAISGNVSNEPQQLPLLALPLDDFLKQNGGLTRLKLKMENATADEIADEMRRQTALDIVPSDELRGAEEKVPRFSVQANGETFWEAVKQWNRGEKKLSVRRSDENRSRWTLEMLDLIPNGRAVLAGPLYAVATSLSLNRSRTINLDPKNPQPAAINLLSLQTFLRLDPKMTTSIAGIIPEIESAVDDKNRILAPDDITFMHWLDEYNPKTSLDMAAPLPDAKTLRTLKGLWRLAVVTQRETWKIDLKATPTGEKTFKSKEIEVTYRFDGIEENNGNYTAKFRVNSRAIGAARVFKAKSRWSRGTELSGPQAVTRSIQFFDAAGEKLSSDGDGTTTMENGVRTVELRLSIGRNPDEKDPEKSAPAAIEINAPLQWREVQIPFEWEDLPLP